MTKHLIGVGQWVSDKPNYRTYDPMQKDDIVPYLPLFRSVAKKRFNRGEIDDVVQYIVLKILERANLEEIKPSQEVKFLVRMSYDLCTDYWRRNKRHQAVGLDMAKDVVAKSSFNNEDQDEIINQIVSSANDDDRDEIQNIVNNSHHTNKTKRFKTVSRMRYQWIKMNDPFPLSPQRI